MLGPFAGGGQNLIDGVLATGTKSGYNFALTGVAGTGSTAVFGAYAVPTTSTGISATGTRRFGMNEDGVLRGDDDLTAAPNTRALIDAMDALGE